MYLGVVIVGFTSLPCGHFTSIYCVAKHYQLLSVVEKEKKRINKLNISN